MNLDFGRISVNVYFMLCCPTKLLALIKNLSLKISRDLCVPTWYIGLAGFRKDCLCCQWHRKQHVNIAGGWLLLCVALWFVVFFFWEQKNCHPGLSSVSSSYLDMLPQMHSGSGTGPYKAKLMVCLPVFPPLPRPFLLDGKLPHFFIAFSFLMKNVWGAVL